ncbi:MAG: hypothetical protein EOO25_15275, partial [Comamonadaceae bacterium]
MSDNSPTQSQTAAPPSPSNPPAPDLRRGGRYSDGVDEGHRGGLRDFLHHRVLIMLALGFSAGLPNLLIFDTLSAWLRDGGVSLAVIGFFSLA